MLIKKVLQFLPIGALVLWLTLGQGIPAARANGPSITIEPANSRIPLGSQVTVEVVIWEAVNVNAYDLTINYDPQRLSLSSWSHGVFLQNLFLITERNLPGELRLAVSQLASPPVSGNGALLKLVFNTLSAGTSAISISQATIAEPNGATYTPALTPGTVEISLDPTFTAQPNPTATPTRTTAPTATNRPPSPTPSLSPGQNPTQPAPQQTAQPTQTGILNSSATPLPAGETAAATELASSALQGQAGMAAFLPYIVNGLHVEEQLADASLYLPMVLHDYTPALLVEPSITSQTTQSAPPDHAEATPSIHAFDNNPKQPGASNRMETVLWAILILSAAGSLWMVKTLLDKPKKP
jgi:hypothetical protein